MLESLKKEIQAAIDQVYADNTDAPNLRVVHTANAAGKRAIKCFRNAAADLHIKARKLKCETRMLKLKRKAGMETSTTKAQAEQQRRTAAEASRNAKLEFAETVRALLPPDRANYWINQLRSQIKIANAEATIIVGETTDQVLEEVKSHKRAMEADKARKGRDRRRNALGKAVMKDIWLTSGEDTTGFSSFVAEASARYSCETPTTYSIKPDVLISSLFRQNMLNEVEDWRWAVDIIYSDDRITRRTRYHRSKSEARPATPSYGRAQAERLLKEAFSA